MNTITDNDIQFTINDQLFMDILLTEIRGNQFHTLFSKKRLSERGKGIRKGYTAFRTELNKDRDNEMLDIRKNKLKGQCIRSKSKWIEEGENPTKYFIYLETRSYGTNKYQTL